MKATEQISQYVFNILLPILEKTNKLSPETKNHDKNLHKFLAKLRWNSKESWAIASVKMPTC